ncbi:MAG: metallophosphoesterase [Chloroflexota bacterium]|nr:metallophosphoesterase [Chloroflexota bacterium]
MLDKISWLHISDFHFRASGDGFSQEVSCDALIRDIPSRLSDEFPLQFIVVTGDIAFSGKSGEYGVAATFFASLLDTLSLDAGRLCIVPGNHDVDRGIQSYLHEGVRSRLDSHWEVDKFLGHDAERSQLMERQAEFRAFRNQLLVDGPGTSETSEGLALVRRFDLDGFRVCVLELNSAWLSGDKDRPGGLLVGERQIIDALMLAEDFDPHLTVALTHHPTDWLVEFDRIACTNRLVPQVDVFHSGHLHMHQASVMLAASSQCLHSAAGSSHQTRHYKNSYNLLEYHVGDGTCKIRQFEYRTDAGVFQELPSIECELPPRGEIQATPSEIANVLRESVPEAEPYAGYMAALLTGWKEEVPIDLNADIPTFASKRLGPEYQFPEVSHFLRISNLLKIFNTVPLHEMFTSQEAVIRGFAIFLSIAASANSEFAGFLAALELQARKLLGVDSTEGTSYQIQYLEELANGGEFDELIDTAVRYSESSDDVVRIAAKRRLALAYLQQDDPEIRNEGSELAFEILDEDWAECSDFVVASVAAESIGDSNLSEKIALRALDYWPSDPDLRAYCRSFAMQRGSQALRERLSEPGGTN